VFLLCRAAASFNKRLNKGRKKLGLRHFVPDLAKHFAPVRRALYVEEAGLRIGIEANINYFITQYFS
jgi:hypothetical protein